MKTYKSIYSFEALEKIVDGETVCMADREAHDVCVVSDLTVLEFAEIVRDIRKNPSRYDFWVEAEEVEETK